MLIVVDLSRFLNDVTFFQNVSFQSIGLSSFIVQAGATKTDNDDLLCLISE